jgi:hypothetical protein
MGYWSNTGFTASSKVYFIMETITFVEARIKFFYTDLVNFNKH